ncbi:hypothetical protein [uncultured Corynebacterium sp.]|uniref:hypothetical protein n=1 Tax=uncultured Corynebacterium sp. TaxID=159447 RepID=UPI0025CC809B|nr:hypothetical protein [uncultured Corynebacterium sp.]
MFDNNRHDNPAGDEPTPLDDHQRDALFRANVHVLPDNWSRARMTWRGFGRMLRDDHSATHDAAA